MFHFFLDLFISRDDTKPVKVKGEKNFESIFGLEEDPQLNATIVSPASSEAKVLDGRRVVFPSRTNAGSTRHIFYHSFSKSHSRHSNNVSKLHSEGSVMM